MTHYMLIERIAFPNYTVSYVEQEIWDKETIESERNVPDDDTSSVIADLPDNLKGEQIEPNLFRHNLFDLPIDEFVAEMTKHGFIDWDASMLLESDTFKFGQNLTIVEE